MQVRAKGFRPDSEDAKQKYRAHREFIQGSRVQLETPNLIAFRKGRVYQANVGMCVASATKRAIQLFSAVRDVESPMVSDMLMYQVGLAAERSPLLFSEDPPSLVDIGTVPEHLLDGVHDLGLVPEDAWPGPASEGWDDAKANDAVAREPTPDLLCRAFDQEGLEFALVDTSDGVSSAIDECNLAGYPVIVSINADGIAERDPGSSVVLHLPANGHNHMVLVLGRNAPGEPFHMDNWWSDPSWPWGIRSEDPTLDGTWLASEHAIEEGAQDIYCVRWAPEFP